VVASWHNDFFLLFKLITISDLLWEPVAQPAQILGAEIFEFGRKTVFCLGLRPSKREVPRYATNFWGMAPWALLATPVMGVVQICTSTQQQCDF